MNKKIRPLLITALVSALFLLALVAAALAAPPDFCGKNGTNSDHPSCSTTEPSVTQPCETITPLGDTGTFSVNCDWTPENTGAAEGTVTVTATSGEISRVVVWVRDSDPGDICVLEQWQKATGTVFEASFPLKDAPGTYWDNGTNWCEPFDPIVGQRDDLNGKPLHVRVYVRAKKGTEVKVSLSPVQADSLSPVQTE